MNDKINLVWLTITILFIIGFILLFLNGVLGIIFILIAILWSIGYCLYKAQVEQKEATQRRQKIEEDKRRIERELREMKANDYRASLEKGEPRPKLHKIYSKKEFSSPEEQRLITLFNAYLEKLNKTIKLTTHIDWLRYVQEAQSFLSLNEELKQTKSQLTLAEKELSEQGDTVLTLPTTDDFAGLSNYKELKQQYMALIKPIKRIDIDILKNFFSKMTVGFISVPEKKALILCLSYVILFDCCTNKIQLQQYKDVTTTVETYTEELPEGKTPREDDDVVNIRYLHQTKSGFQDNRYSFNPSYITVRRARISLKCLEYVGTINFTNKQKADDFLTRFEAYRLFLTEGKRTPIAPDLFDDALLDKHVKTKQPQFVVTIPKVDNPSIFSERKPPRNNNSLSMQDLSTEEIALVLGKRREKEKELQEQERQQQVLKEQAAIEFNGANVFEPIDETRVITNNLFSFTYQQVAKIEGDTKYEFVFVDQQGRLVSSSKTIDTQDVGQQIKLTFDLLGNINFDTKSTYYLLIRCRETNDGALRGKISYKINVSFGNEFGI